MEVPAIPLPDHRPGWARRPLSAAKRSWRGWRGCLRPFARSASWGWPGWARAAWHAKLPTSGPGRAWGTRWSSMPRVARARLRWPSRSPPPSVGPCLEALSQAQALLVLDGCDTLGAEAMGWAGRLAANCPGLAILLTAQAPP